MGAIATLTLTDDEATPVDHSFTPIEASPQQAVWTELSAADEVYLRPNVIAQFRASKGPGQTSKATLRLNMPVWSVVDSLVQDRGTARVIAEVILPATLTGQERDNLIAMFRDLIDEQVVTDLVNGNPPY